MSNTVEREFTEYGICSAKGEVEDGFRYHEVARQQIDLIRLNVADGSYEPEDFPEPLTIVKRQVKVVTTTTAWEQA